MKDRKALFLLVFSLLIVTISFTLISIWGYHFYYAGKNKRPVQNAEQPAHGYPKMAIRDSLQSLARDFNDVLENPNDSVVAGIPVDTELASRILQFNRLKNEITEILRSREVAEADKKISQLQKCIEALQNKNDTILRENQRLTEMVKMLVKKNENAKHSKITGSKRLKNSAYSLPVLVSHLRFLAYSLNDKKKQTNLAAKTERLYGSFQVNIKTINTNNSIYVVVIQPNGKTLLNSMDIAPTFDTRNGKKVYSALIKFENKKDNGSRLGFSIDSHNFQKGTYTMQIYHQGVMIGKLTRTLF